MVQLNNGYPRVFINGDYVSHKFLYTQIGKYYIIIGFINNTLNYKRITFSELS